jgi:glycosyltransferase involved in cell wall biosynthesis
MSGLSVVIPVFNSALYLERTVEKVVEVLRSDGQSFEVLLINDGSTDGTWNVITNLTGKYCEVVGVDLVRNVGQHSALLCGLCLSTGDYVATLDDDLQQPPDEIPRMLNFALSSHHDLVIGAPSNSGFQTRFRRSATRGVNFLVTQIFGKPNNLRMSPFRLVRRDVVDRMHGVTSSRPYIPGELLLRSKSAANFPVEFQPRAEGSSGYRMSSLIELVRRIVFGYSLKPLRLVVRLGLIFSTLSFLTCIAVVIQKWLTESSVVGWASTISFLSVFFGILFFMIGMMGEYLMVMLDAIQRPTGFQIAEIIRKTSPSVQTDKTEDLPGSS